MPGKVKSIWVKVSCPVAKSIDFLEAPVPQLLQSEGLSLLLFCWVDASRRAFGLVFWALPVTAAERPWFLRLLSASKSKLNNFNKSPARPIIRASTLWLYPFNCSAIIFNLVLIGSRTNLATAEFAKSFASASVLYLADTTYKLRPSAVRTVALLKASSDFWCSMWVSKTFPEAIFNKASALVNKVRWAWRLTSLSMLSICPWIVII